MSLPTTTPQDSATERPMVTVDVYGPNLLVDGPTFHVHAPNCMDTRRMPYIQHEPWTGPVTDLDQIVLDTYPPEHFDWDEDNEAAFDEYRADFKVFPCVHWPKLSKPVSEENKPLMDALNMERRITTEYEEAFRAYFDAPDEGDTDSERDRARKLDSKFYAALGASKRVTDLRTPSFENRPPRGTTSRRSRKEPVAREGAPSKDGEMVCTGPCGEKKSVTKFPTTNSGTRSSECRECRSKRRAAKKATGK